MNELQVMECDVATLEDCIIKELYVKYLPKVEKRCRELKKEVKDRITENGELEGLKIYEDPAGVDILDIEGFYKEFKEYIDKDEFIKNCVKVNLTAFKKIVIERIQEAKLEGGVNISKRDVDAMITLKSKEFGKEKTKKVIL